MARGAGLGLRQPSGSEAARCGAAQEQREGNSRAEQQHVAPWLASHGAPTALPLPTSPNMPVCVCLPVYVCVPVCVCLPAYLLAMRLTRFHSRARRGEGLLSRCMLSIGSPLPTLPGPLTAPAPPAAESAPASSLAGRPLTTRACPRPTPCQVAHPGIKTSMFSACAGATAPSRVGGLVPIAGRQPLRPAPRCGAQLRCACRCSPRPAARASCADCCSLHGDPGISRGILQNLLSVCSCRSLLHGAPGEP